MKKINIILAISFILMIAGIVIADTIINREVTLTTQELTALRKIGLDRYNYIDYEKDGLYMRCLNKANAIDTCSKWFKTQRELDDWELKRLKGIANATIEREATINKVSEGEVTVTGR